MLQRGLHIVGSSVGTPPMMEELIQMALDGKVVPELEVREFEELGEVLAQLERYQIEGRVVVKIPQ